MDTLNISTSYITKEGIFDLGKPEIEVGTALPFNSGGSYCIPLEGIKEYYINMKNQVKKVKIYQNDLIP